MNYKKKKKTAWIKLFILFLILLLLGVTCSLLLNQETNYHLVVIDQNGKTQELQTYSTFQQAKNNMKALDHGENENIAILTDSGKRVAIRYGVVNFQTKKCTINTNYKIADRDETGYTNGCYGADAAYLDTSDDGKQIKFMQAGVIGWVDLKDVEILNFYNEKEVASVSHYVVDNGTFLHKGTTNIKKEAYAFANTVGLPFKDTAYSYYYSYDGHYFYPSFSSMIDDYQLNSRKNSVNANAPYYNYYQYLPHRTISKYTAGDIDSYIKDTLGYQSSPNDYPMKEQETMLYQSGKSFITAQNKYSTNAIMMLALSMNETGYGTSELSFEKNNLFGHAAYDASPSKSANKYATTAESILVHASVFLNQGYLNACDGADDANSCDSDQANRYRGAYFGDKESGMNVRYASDPYWGEKAAALYRKFDEAMGKKDSKFKFIIRDVEHTALYQQPDTDSRIVYKTPDVKTFSFLIAEKTENAQGTWYKVKSDAPLKDGTVDLQADAYSEKNSYLYLLEK